MKHYLGQTHYLRQYQVATSKVAPHAPFIATHGRPKWRYSNRVPPRTDT